MLILEYDVNVIFESIPKVNIAKVLFEAIRRKFIKFDNNDKHHYLNLLNYTMYDEV